MAINLHQLIKSDPDIRRHFYYYVCLDCVTVDDSQCDTCPIAYYGWRDGELKRMEDEKADKSGTKL